MEENPFLKYVNQDEENPFLKYKAQTIPPIDTNPTSGMSAFERGAAGAGKYMVDIARGAGQWIGAVDRKDIEESRRMDKALMDTTAGKVGNFVGGAATLVPSMLIPGANTVAGAGAIGALTGAMQPSTGTGETLSNIAFGGAGGAGGQFVANKIPGIVGNYAASQQAKAAQDAASNAQKFKAAQAGRELGYVTPPADLNPGLVSETLSGLSGKIKTAQTASQRNQQVTDTLARRALGLPDTATLNYAELDAVRNAAGKAYEAVKGAGIVKPDATYEQALNNAVKPFLNSAKSFPGSKVPGVVDDVMALKTGAFDAGAAIDKIKILRDQADTAYRNGMKSEGKAYKDAAMALEDAIESHLSSIGAPAADLLKGYRNARQLIAKSYTVEKALNDTTGSINAQVLASMYDKRKPLSGELLDVAKYANAFPKATQMLKESPKQVSPLDFAVAGGTAITSANPLPLALIGARPAVRSLMLSDAVQKQALIPGYAPSLTSRALPGLLDNELFRLSAPSFGIQGGLLASDWAQ